MSTKLASDTQLSLQQQTWGLSFLSNMFNMNDLSNEAQARQKLQDIIDNYVNANAADGEHWEVTWGPVGVADPKKNPGIPANVMYAAKNSTSGTDYVVAIAGTLPGSTYDVLNEDKKSELQTFKAPGGNSFSISQGTIDGLSMLLNLQDSSGLFLIGSDAGDGYLQSINGAGDDINVVVTGHSLGGALSPAMALTLYYARQASGTLGSQSQGNWDTKELATVSFLETAGPAVGNQDYVNQLGKACPNSAAIWNCIDIVPHAWWNLEDSQGLCNSSASHPVNSIKQIYTPYDASYVPSDRLTALIDGAIEKQSPDHIPINNQYGFIGEFQTFSIPSKCSFNKNIYYIAEIMYQHIEAYCIHFNCLPLLPYVAHTNSSLPLACTTLQKLYPETDCTCLS